MSGDLLQEYEDMGRQSVFHPDGLHILGDSGFTSEAFSVPTSQKQMTTESISGLAITPDGSRLLVASGRDVTTCDSQTYEGIRRIAQEDSLIYRFAISSDGQKIVTGTDRQSEQDQSAYARVRDSSNGDLIGMPMRHPDRVMGVSLSPDGTRLATVCFDGGLRIWNVVTGDLLEEAFAESMLAPGQPLQGPAKAIAFSPDGKMLAFGSSHRSSLWSLSPLRQIRELETSQTSSGGPIHLSFSPDGTRLLSVYSFGTAQLWDVKTGQPVGEVIRSSSEGSGGIQDASFSPDGSLVVVAMFGDVRFFDAWTGVPVRRPFRYTYVTQLEFSPDGSRLISGDAEGKLRVWETTPLPMPKNLSDMLTRHAYHPGQRITLPPFPGLEHSAEQIKTCREEWMSTLRDWQNDRCRKSHLIAIQDAQDRENWFAMEFHLRQLLRIDPNNAGVQNLHQYANRRLDQPFTPKFTELNQDEYQWDANIGVRRGLRPSKLVVSAKGDAVFYSGEFVPIENRVWWARHGITKDEFERTHAQHTSNGLTLDCHSFVTIGERVFHAAVWLGK